LIGIAGLFTYLRRRNAAVSNIVLSDDENQRIDALLKNAEQDKKGAQ
jgi:cytochrome c-type biogenesis protein CcmH